MKSRIYFLGKLIDKLRKENATYWIIRPLPKAVPQRGPTCGLFAASYSMAIFHNSNPDYPLLSARKNKIEKTSLRSFYKQAGIHGIGAIFDTEQFKLFSAPANYDADSQSFTSQEEMSQILLNNLMRNKPVIISCDLSGRDEHDSYANGKGKKIIGSKGNGEHPHYITIVGYYQKNGEDLHYIFSSWGQWMQVSVKDLFESSNSLKAYPGCTDYKLESNIWTSTLPAELSQEAVENLRKNIIPPTDLSKLRNRCIIMQPKNFNEKLHYTQTLSRILKSGYPININIVNLLCQTGANIDKKDLKGWPIIPKNFSAESIIETATTINQLMDFIIFQDNRNGFTQEDFIELIKTKRVRVDREIDEAPSVLHRAVLANAYKIIPYLIQYGMNADVNIMGEDKKTLLHYAVKINDINMVSCLLKQENININAKDEIWCNTPLHLANNPEMVLALLNAGADINAEDIFKHTPFYNTVLNQHLEVLSNYLALPKAHTYQLKFNNKNIVHNIAELGSVPLMQMFLAKYDYLVDDKDNDGNTLLHSAASKKRIDMIKFLITQYQLDINASNFANETALNYLEDIAEDDVQWLIEHDADFDRRERLLMG